MILVTCPGGKTGRAVIAALATAGEDVRALVRRAEAAADAKAAGAAEAAVGDLADAVSVAKAAEGVTAIYYIAPNMNPEERAFGDNVIAAARQCGARLVFHSVLHPQLEALPHHWQRHFVEQAILESGVPFTILQPGSYMQNMLPGWAAMVRSGVHRLAYDVDVPMSLVDLDDIAEAARRVLTGPGFENGVFELAGPPITLREKAAILTQVLGREIRAEKQPLDAFLKQAEAHGAGDYARGCMAKMMPHYDAHGLVGNPKVLGWILGRAPTDFETFARRIAAGG